jgi:hypothetical protein
LSAAQRSWVHHEQLCDGLSSAKLHCIPRCVGVPRTAGIAKVYCNSTAKVDVEDTARLTGVLSVS